ncbi:ArsR/SmtB family transcription factor [Polycladidibacter hongkongensis]|uniref:ArsR/SmtB family transcription factor n=1 Tax=Polycladidibacter hongkongensis TaxID=1647556 RepID=UPI000832C145|nr:metalloregulator ArsR/SmtB family transcription factor [Pseudovibrio hongkongensis]
MSLSNKSARKKNCTFDADTPQNRQLAALTKALAHPVRLEILRSLSNCEQACCADLVSWLPLAQSTVSQHLKVLAEAELIAMTTKGRTTCIRLNADSIAASRESMSCFLKMLENSPTAQKLPEDDA